MTEIVYILEAQGYVYRNGEEDERVPESTVDAVDLAVVGDDLYMLADEGYVYKNGEEDEAVEPEDSITPVAMKVVDGTVYILDDIKVWFIINNIGICM